ncbi:hypothetical protein KZO01_20000 [Kurthia zopfii]|uniref:Carboxy-terminal processing protease CtpB n=1 Tax=Kurthia zopfii TaxID=1650 RepID=A0A8B4Q8F2_9BACL|nr:S41 family peptidase [Kurthia zopfii]PWI22508.1 hypothetical protein DF281_06735 [Kurthia zopfii]TDR38638.1 carboxyl-terminal processing protease [Kurthia zopfii]GEK31691.1 hypothetical protein KZO01_20000 [Kurthia zopfii]STX08755.1 Carboxy-terminal processing protease CtpB precursor [Kurthia zopfii]
MKKWKLLSVSILSMFIVAAPLTDVEAKEPMKEVKELVENYYYPNVSKENLQSSKTIKQLMSKLDPYSVFMSTSEVTDFFNQIGMKFAGIGVSMVEDPKGLKITEVLPKSPALKAGLLKGQIITEVNNRILAGAPFEEASNLIKGKVNTAVTLKVYDPKTKKTLTKKIIRKEIYLPNVEVKQLAGQVGYIRLNSFASNSAADLIAHMKKLPNAKRWIVDVRGNGGGEVEAAEKVIGIFSKAQLAYIMKYAHDPLNYVQIAKKQSTQINSKVALLVDGHSASASEMLAGALKEQNAATLYGQKTYGKGVQQVLFQLKKNAGFIKLTVGEFYAPTSTGKMVKINKIGVKPHVVTKKGDEVKVSHQALMRQSMAKEDRLPKISVSAKKQQMILSPSKQFTWTQLKSAKLYLLQVGGVSRKITVKQLPSKKLQITAPTGLKAGSSYYLNVKPTKGKAAFAYVSVGK